MLRPLCLVGILAAAAAPSAVACGVGGYSYAGMSSPSHAYGIAATITPLTAPDVLSGHVAGWIGVGGPGKGPGGTDEWLQVGFSAFAGSAGNSLYYEVATPHGTARYHQLAAGLPNGRTARVAVVELRGRPGVWRVWVNGRPASRPVDLPGSHGRFAPVATAESWDGNTGGACNGFLYRFHGVAIAQRPGGGWAPLRSSDRISSASTRLHLGRTSSSFLAAQGGLAFRVLASFTP